MEAQRQKILQKSKSQPLNSFSPQQKSPQRSSAVSERVATRQSHVNTDPRFLQDLLLCECGEELHPADRKLHVDNECPLRMVTCSRPGCNQPFQAHHKVQHDQEECFVARHSRKLLQAKEDGDRLVECEICGDRRFPIRKRDLQRHQLYQCVKRLATCQFAQWGCADKFPSDEREAHEAHACVVAKRRQQIADDALLVNETTACDWCHQPVKKRQLLDHQEDECLERERPCPNAVNGCKEWVPVGKLDDHIRTTCSVTLERNALAAKAREKNTPVVCKECGLSVKLRSLDRHWRDECVSRVVSCKNAAHGCKARLRWRDRHLHEDFMALSRDRSMLQFQTGGTSYIAVQGASGSDLAPPWTAEYFVWMVEAEEEILDLHRSSLLQLETQVLNAREHQRWQMKSEACKTKLKELKQQRKQKSSSSSTNQQKLSSAELSAAAKNLADEFNASETGALATQKAVTLAKGWIQIFLTEALRIFNHELPSKKLEKTSSNGDTETHSEQQIRGEELRTAIAQLTTQILQEKPVLMELLSQTDLSMLSDLETWAKSVAGSNSSSKGGADSVERQQKLAELKKLLKKRSEWQDLLAGLTNEAVDGESPDAQAQVAERERLRRRYERELAKVDAKLAIVSENTPTELLERRGRHVIASSAKNAIALVAGTQGHVTFYRSSLPSSSKAAREVHLECQLPRRQWSHVALSASKKELSLFLNGELQGIKRGVFDLPLSFIGSNDNTGNASFQGCIQEIRYWRECRTAQQLQQLAHSIVNVAKHKESLLAYWTLEEGMGELVDDMALSLPRAPCFNTKWVLYDTPAIRKRFGVPPTPSLRDKTCCVVNQKLKVLAQRARDRERDVVSCRQQCGETVALQLLDAHHRMECAYRLVVCKEIGCGQVYRFSDELQHLNERCERHLFREKLLRRYQEKEVLESCLLNCGSSFKKRFSDRHYHSECVNRFVTCPRLDCQETIVAKTLDVHLAKECRSQEFARERKLVENARRRLKEKQLLMGNGLPAVATESSSERKTQDR